jgi:hypothetical protein
VLALVDRTTLKGKFDYAILLLWDNALRSINKNGSIRGLGARSSRGWILRAYEWYKIAKRETLTNLPDDFIDSLIFDPQS